MIRTKKTKLAFYGLAIVITLLAAWLRYLIHPYLKDEVPFVTFFISIVIIAWYGGLGPTLLAIVLSGLVAVYFFIPPFGSLLPTEPLSWIALVIFIGFGLVTAVLIELMRRKAEQAYQEREQFLVTLSSIGDGVIVTDDEAHVTFLNAVAEELTGWTNADAYGKPLTTVFRIINETSRKTVESPVIQALREGRIIGLANHTLLITRDGTERAIDDSAAPIRETDGKIIGVVLIFRDVSEKRALQIAQARLAALVDSSEDAILGYTFEGLVTEWNQGAERLFGYTAEETIGKPVFSTIVPADHKDDLLQMMQRIRQGESLGHIESIRQKKDGRRIPVSIRISPIRNAEGELIGVSGIDRDISQQRATERRRNARLTVTQILAEEESIEQAIRQLLAAICSALEWDVGCFWCMHSAENVLKCEEFWQQTSRDLSVFEAVTRKLTFHPGESLPGWVWQTGQPLWVPDVAVDSRLLRLHEARQVGLHGGLACPVTVGKEFLGVIEFFSHEIQQPDDDLTEMLTTIGGQLGQYIERRQAERELADAEARVRSIMNNVVDGIITIDDQGIIAMFNPAAEQIFGYTSTEVIGQNVRVLIPDSQRSQHDTYLRDYFHTGEAQIIGSGREVVGKRKDGSTFPLDLAVGEFHINSHRFFTGVVRDITERKRTEQALRFLAEASRSLSSLVDYKSTLQKVAHMAVPSFADWCSVDMLNAAGSMERLAVAHIDPTKVELVEEIYQRYPPDPNAPRGMYHVLRTGKPEMIAHIPEALIVAAARDEEHLRIIRSLQLHSYMCVPLETKGRMLGTLTFAFAESGREYRPDDLVMAEDLAHRAAIAIENARLYQEVREADRRKDEFLAMLAHELRNPLAPIRTGLDVLAMDPGQHQEAIQLMQEQVRHVVRLVDDLLDVSRIMRDKVELRQETIELAAILQRSLQVVQEMIDSHHQELVVSIPEEPIWLYADPVRLAQVVENLLNNASKYTHHGGCITVTVEHQDDQVVLTVQDNGMGIEPELLPRVFDVFTQSSRTLDRSQGGMGIGLTLVRRLVEMHGGTVTAHSPGPGQGSTFIVRLPVVERSTPTPEEAEQPEQTQGRRRILVVDDNVGAVRLLSLLLTKLGDHEIETAYDGPSALEKFKQTHPQLVLLDIGLPGMDGYQVGKAIRDMDHNHVLLVALTGYGQAEDRRASQKAGFDEHLVKPPSIEQIKEILAHPKLERSRPV